MYWKIYNHHVINIWPSLGMNISAYLHHLSIILMFQQTKIKFHYQFIRVPCLKKLAEKISFVIDQMIGRWKWWWYIFAAKQKKKKIIDVQILLNQHLFDDKNGLKMFRLIFFRCFLYIKLPLSVCLSVDHFTWH